MRAPDDMPRRERRTRVRSGRGRVLLIVAIVALFILITSLRGIASFYTDYLWFKSVGQTGVWRGVLGTKLVLAGVFSAGFFLLLWINLFIADRIAPAFRPTGPEEEMLERYHEIVGSHQGMVRAGVAFVFAVIVGAPASAQWNEWLLFRNYVPFGIEDQQFHNDVGFYVFKLPFLTFLVNWVFTAFVVAFIITALAHYLNGGIRVQTPLQRVTPQVKAHLSLLLGVLALVKATDYYLHQFELTTSTRGTVDGPTYTDIHAQLPAIRLLLLISIAALVLFIVNIFRRGWVLPVLGVGLSVFIAVVAGTIVPAFMQRFRVQPSESSRERPYIERNIEATRNAYGLGDVETVSFAADASLTTQGLIENATTVTNARLWDPDQQILQQNYQQLQALKNFYRINDVDVDRYMIDGKLRQTMIAARELNPSGIPQPSWESTHMTYTHGYGVAMAPANRQVADGRPDLLVRDIPVKSSVIEVDQPALYFGDGLSGYVMVNTKRQEVDYEGTGGETVYGSYAGADGVGVGSWINRAAFALRFGDVNPLFSGNVTESSKVLIYRDVRSRLRAIAPFLEYDSDPYPVVIDGRVQWIVDAYTTTDRYPYSQRAITEGNQPDSGLRGRFNYVRNSVKAVIDAYDGSVSLYIVDRSDPIVRAYAKAFPKLFSAGDPSPELRAHFRYPEDLFRVQTNMWGRYHINNPNDFYFFTNGWTVARSPGATVQKGGTTTTTTQQPADPNEATGPKNRVDPYYLLMSLPDEGDEEQSFLIFRPFVPVPVGNEEKQQLTAFMIARAHPTEEGKQQLISYVMPTDNQPDGPELVANTMQVDTNVSRLNTELGAVGGGSDILYGNLITLPINQSLLYIRPVYVETSQAENKLPLLRKVIVEYNKQVAVADTLPQALRLLPGFANLPPLPGEEELIKSPDGTQTPPPPSTEDLTATDLLNRANDAFAAADAALKEDPPDFAEYAEKVKEARDLMRRALEELNTSSSPATATTSSTTSTTVAGA